MGAIIKKIAIHSNSVNPLLKYCGNQNKTSLSRNLIENPDLNVSAALDYAANPLKTICNIDENHKELLTTGVNCEPATAAQEFAMARQRYREMTGNMEDYEPFEYKDRRTGKTKTVKRQPVTAIHMIQSFAETDLDPHTVHMMGVELLDRLGLQGVVDTHLNKEHLHNHLIINTYCEGGVKWNCNKEELLRVREISDDIQREYGIDITFRDPKEQLYQSKGQKHSYKEWLEQEEGVSWKDQMREDIRNIKHVAKNRNDYLSIMEAYGYKVEAEYDDEVTFVVEENGKKINDITLGKEFSIGELFPKNPEKQRTLEYHLIPLKTETISVARYNADGTKRSLLEMLIRKAIAKIQMLIGLFNKDYDFYTTYSPQDKIDRLNAALDVIKANEIGSKTELRDTIDKTGAQLSHMKAQMAKLDSEKNMYDTLLSAINLLEDLRAVDTHFVHMDLHKYTQEEVRHNRAKLAPISPSEKSALALAFREHPEYSLSCKYHDLTPSEAQKVIDFLRGNSEEQPFVVVKTEDRERDKAIELAKRVYEGRQKGIITRFGDVQADEKTIRQIEKLLSDNGIERQFTELSQADAMEIRNCYTPNPFTSPTIDQSQQEALLKVLESRGLKLNRPINYLTVKEATQLMGWLKEPTKYREPSVLKPFEKPRENDVDNALKIMKVKGITTTVPVSVMSKQDFERFYTHLVYAGQEPQALQNSRAVTNEERDDDFMARIEDYKPERILYLTQYRDALNILRSCGYEVGVHTNLDDIKTEVEEWLSQYDEFVEAKEQCSQLYHDLVKTRSIVDKAETHEFIYGQQIEKEAELVVEEKEEKQTAEEAQREFEEEQKRKKEKQQKLLKILTQKTTRGKDKGR